jgi:hypothetical protein
VHVSSGATAPQSLAPTIPVCQALPAVLKLGLLLWLNSDRHIVFFSFCNVWSGLNDLGQPPPDFFFAVVSDLSAVLYTRDRRKVITVCERSEWAWARLGRSSSNFSSHKGFSCQSLKLPLALSPSACTVDIPATLLVFYPRFKSTTNSDLDAAEARDSGCTIMIPVYCLADSLKIGQQ